MGQQDLHSFFALMGADDDYEGKEIEVYGKKDADVVMDEMEKQIKHLDSLCIKRFSKIHKLANDLENANARIKELESREDSLNSACRCLNNRIKELEDENFKLKIKLGNKVVPSILNAKNEECLMERIKETK